MRRKISSGLALLALTGCSASASTNQAVPPRRTPAVAQPVRAPVVMILGDSYTAGIRGVPPESTYAGDTARKLGWQAIIAGHGGTGFVARGAIRRNFGQLFTEQLSWRPAPDMVLIVGGHNDAVLRQPLPSLAENATKLITAIRTRWPGVPLVLVGPIWGGDPPAKALQVRDALALAAAGQQVPFIDPLREMWFTGSRGRGTGNADLYIRRDRVHPNPAGNAYLADRLIMSLKPLGLEKPGQK
ncbi:MAG: SGNH/GDSL hydrolase family protein [Streptosporangiaceae bacterium]